MLFRRMLTIAALTLAPVGPGAAPAAQGAPRAADTLHSLDAAADTRCLTTRAVAEPRLSDGRERPIMSVAAPPRFAPDASGVLRVIATSGGRADTLTMGVKP